MLAHDGAVIHADRSVGAAYDTTAKDTSDGRQPATRIKPGRGVIGCLKALGRVNALLAEATRYRRPRKKDARRRVRPSIADRCSEESSLC
jgi:tRNA(Ile2) C34 agmatinyltransferase TiaS